MPYLQNLMCLLTITKESVYVCVFLCGRPQRGVDWPEQWEKASERKKGGEQGLHYNENESTPTTGPDRLWYPVYCKWHIYIKLHIILKGYSYLYIVTLAYNQCWGNIVFAGITGTLYSLSGLINLSIITKWMVWAPCTGLAPHPHPGESLPRTNWPRERLQVLYSCYLEHDSNWLKIIPVVPIQEFSYNLCSGSDVS